MKMKKGRSFILILLLLVATIKLSVAQFSEEGNISFSCQAKIDAFPSMHPGVTTIEGTLYLYNTNAPATDITNLDSLIQITTIKGDLLIIRNLNLETLSGLDNLESVHGTFAISKEANLSNLDHLDQLTKVGKLRLSQNYALTDLSGLKNLKEISEGLHFFDNDALRDFKDLESIETIGEYLWIVNEDSIESFNGLNNITTLNELTILANNKISNLEGLTSLRTVVSDVNININENLINLNGFENLEFIGGQLTINKNEKLTDLSGMHPKSLRTAEGLSITNNPSLKTLSGLEDYELIHLPFIQISSNAQLETCHAKSICDYMSFCKNLVIFDNAASCNTLDEIETTCNSRSDYDFQWRCPISLFPNPINNFMNIKTTRGEDLGSFEYEIRDMLGCLIREGNHDGLQLNLSFLTAGTYYITIKSSKQEIKQRFVKI